MRRFLSTSFTGDLLKKTGRCLLVVLFIIAIYTNAVAQSSAPVPDSEMKVKDYLGQALKLLNRNEPDQAESYVKLAQDQKESAVAYYYLCDIHEMHADWDSAIQAGERSVQLDPSFLPVYSLLITAYTKRGEWSKADKIRDKVQQADPAGSVATLKDLDESIANDSRANYLLVLLFLALGAAFLYPLLNTKTKAPSLPDNNDFRFSEIFIVSASVSCLFWLLFQSYSHSIWSFSPHIDPYLFTPAVKMCVFGNDGGIESFVLYVMLLAGMGLTLLLANLLLKLKNSNLYLGVFSGLFLLAAYYFYKISFIPPMYDMRDDISSTFPVIFVVLAIISFGAYFLYERFSLIIKIILVLLMAYASLVMIYPASLMDISYILYPALRMTEGTKIHEIYFQYDLFLSFIAYGWMKLNFSIDTFPYIGQVSYFVFFVASFFFADRLFKTKWLSVLFITALVLIRYYSIAAIGMSFLQITPLRLDLWIIPLMIAYYKGVHHWLVGTALGLLIIFHRNLGIIYTIAYAELLVVLFVLDAIPLLVEHQFVSGIGKLFVRHLRLNLKNILILLASVALCLILFKELFSPSVLIYRKIGVGMLRVSNISFYWYVPVMVSCLTVLLYRFRNKLGEQYSVTGMFILLLLVGNSMYFFGRSHESNIINISAILILALFVLFDILIYLSPKEEVAVTVTSIDKKNKKTVQKTTEKKTVFFSKRTAYISLPFLFLFLSGFYYSGTVSEKVGTQYDNFVASQYICPPITMQVDTSAVQQITTHSRNVFFLDFQNDFYYYYYGHYVPLGYFNPLESWIYRKELVDFMQDLLNKHYYIVYNARSYNDLTDYIPYLNYDHTRQQNDLVSLSKEDINLLLPATPSEILHAAIKDTVPKNGMDFPTVAIKNDFTIELLVKPTGPQTNNATILSNFNKTNQLTGLILQANSKVPGEYLFTYSNGQIMPAIYFPLQADQWNYLTIVISKTVMKVYNNGKLVSNYAVPGSLPIVYGDTPLTIGNAPTRDAHFSGYIQEVKISNGNIDEATIMNNWQNIQTALK
ncbi:MAG TPA: LamG-like jellyroll fold domain-containing protein [Ferruginibacter sp.]|nr:LamG-like jellyroll fold domain-containing protein [Ferruginibacter sp.]